MHKEDLAERFPGVSFGENVRIGGNVRIDQRSSIGANTVIGDFSIIHANCHVGSNCNIGPYSTIGEPCSSYYACPDEYVFPETRIDSGSLIRSHAVIYASVIIGEHFQCGHRVTIREETIIGRHVRIGTLSDIQGYCSIGSYVSLHSSVHVGQKSTIEDFVWIYPYTVLTNDPTPPSATLNGVTVKRFAVIATATTILPGIVVEEDTLVGAHSLVRENVHTGTVVAGVPAKEIATIDKVKDKTTGECLYPWRFHFERGMPWEGVGYAVWAGQEK
ncbi:MAG TPA: hypothetical protein PLB91_02350 [Spirochaetales bacterium]|nr:hypothetical protein [Spirochaetales bacterium]HRY53127.1 N-acetyltransferase [Spirochaetia bacterium]